MNNSLNDILDEIFEEGCKAFKKIPYFKNHRKFREVKGEEEKFQLCIKLLETVENDKAERLVSRLETLIL